MGLLMTDSAADYRRRILLIMLFGVAMGYLEAAVVVYLRALFYPAGFAFPLHLIPQHLLVVELIREAATVAMLFSVSFIAGRRGWERFGYFLILFGVWDLFYYVWLKAIVNWPSSLLEWDILFLLPIPWIGPVIAPILIAALMVFIGLAVTALYRRAGTFTPTILSWFLCFIATALILYSFMHDTAATLRQQPPHSYPYVLLGTGLLLYAAAFWHAYKKSARAFT